MKKRITFLAAAAAAAVAVPAAAQERSAFSGFRVEALAGYDDSRPGSSVPAQSSNLNRDNDGVSYGAGIGYDVDLGRAVIGVEGEYMDSSAKTDYDTTGFATYGVSHFEAGRDLYAGVRAGMKVGPRSLIYVKGGYTNAKYNILATDNTTYTGTDLKLDGWRVGAGAEMAITPHMYVKGEYRYSNYSDGEVVSPTGVTSDNFDVDVDRHQVVVGVGARF